MKCSKAVFQHVCQQLHQLLEEQFLRRVDAIWHLMIWWSHHGEPSHVWHRRCILVHGMKQCADLPQTQEGSQARHLCICAHCIFKWAASVAIYPPTCPFELASVGLIQRCVQRVWMPVSEECEQNGRKWRGGYCWGALMGCVPLSLLGLAL